MSDAVAKTQLRLGVIADQALASRGSRQEQFAALRRSLVSPGEGVVLFEGDHAVAWAGDIRSRHLAAGTGTWTSFDDFYVTLHVSMSKGGRRAVALSLVHAEPPSDVLAQALDERLPERRLVERFRFAPAGDTASGRVIRGAGGFPLMQLDATALPPALIQFADAATARGRGVLLVGLLLILQIGMGWSNRRKLARRLFTLGVAAAAVAMIPWSSFSNFSRAFDPAYFYDPIGGPFTATAGSFGFFALILLLAAIAMVRARRIPANRLVSGAVAVVTAVAGALLTREAAGGIVLPRSGATTTLWLEWQLPLFVTFFASLLIAAWLGEIALRKRPRINLRTVALIGVLSGSYATFLVWNRTTEQRLQLAMRDVAGLSRSDSDVTLLLSRFGLALENFDSPGSRADLLKRYAASDLAAAEVQVALGAWDSSGTRYGTLDLARLSYDSLELARRVAETDSASVVTQTLGPTGRQLVLVVAHRDGGRTTVVASPRTRLVDRDPFVSLLGLATAERTEAPYALTLGDAPGLSKVTADAMTWRRIGSEWHGDQVIETSLGAARAHVEVDIRGWGVRLVRASLVIILDLLVVVAVWILGAMAEGGFFRWIRTRAGRWARSYRGRLTLALFAFFVVPAVAFGVWSYQRLRADDRDVRELLVRETLNAAVADFPAAVTMPESGGPFFLYSGGMLESASDSLLDLLSPAGRLLPPPVNAAISEAGELAASWQQSIGNSRILWGYRDASSFDQRKWVLSAPARTDDIVLDRRRRDLTMLVLFATAMGAIAAFWLSGIAARVLARDLELSRVEVARAERVLAWGEMARQVAHEIKNPLTPIRLGVQHLRRARADTRVDFDRVLDENVTRILSEIDRLDEIARAFSRYGSAPSELPPAERVDAASILRDVVALEKMGIGGVTWTLAGADDPAYALARGDELKDVLLNVFENARLARARNVGVTLHSDSLSVVITVSDDGAGIDSSALGRVFEPHFSTRTTGSGLGLAISRRLLESWDGTIDLASEKEKGAKVTITLHAAPA
jgi:signal transduction histidine kinase